MKPAIHLKRKGSALVLALCAVAILSFTVLGLVELTDLGMSELADKGKDFRAMQLAESGLALGLYPDLERDDPVLQQKLSETESFNVSFASESGRLNINALLLGKQEEVLERLLRRWGVKSTDQSIIIDSLMDWVDGDPLKRMNGAEQRDYEALGLAGYPPDRPFQDLEEIELVRGIKVLSKVKPDWKDSFTVWTDGKLDLNEASSDLIAASCGVGSVVAEAFVKRRIGSDGKAGTQDDFEYTDMGQVRNALGLSEKAFEDISRRVTLTSDYRRIESTGRVASYERKLAVVVQLNVTPVQYMTWIEF